jgi:hypothetical protein
MPDVNRNLIIHVAVSAAQAAATVAAVGLLLRARNGVRKKTWSKLVDARGNMKSALDAGDSKGGELAAQWIGGGLAIYGSMIGEDPRTLLNRLSDEVPIDPNAVAPRPGDLVKSPDSEARFRAIERERPPPPPGAPKPIDPHDLTPEEREEYGIFLPEEMEAARAEATTGDVD